MFDLEELEKLKAIGARRVRWADGTEVEFYGPFPLEYFTGSPPPRQMPGKWTEPDAEEPAQMPSRQELRAQAAKLTPDTDGAPVVTP